MGQIIAALLALIGVILTQALLHHQWAKSQDQRREEMLTKAAEDRRAEAERQANERRQEQATFLATMADQTNTVVANAVKLAEEHREDAETARLLAIETARQHAECRSEVAALGGKLEELRARVVETERTAGIETLFSEKHRDVKHMTITALAASEGVTTLAVTCAKGCTCGAFEAMSDLLANWKPRLNDVMAENNRVFAPAAVYSSPQPE